MFYLILFLNILSGELVLTNGKRVPFQGEYRIEGTFVRFENLQGELLQLPLKLIDLERTKAHNAPKAEAESAAVSVKQPPKPGTLARALDNKRAEPLVVNKETMRHYARIDTAVSSEELNQEIDIKEELENNQILKEFRRRLESSQTAAQLRGLYRDLTAKRDKLDALVEESQGKLAEVRALGSEYHEQIELFKYLLDMMSGMINAIDQLIDEVTLKADLQGIKL